MHLLAISDLPSPGSNKVGWPWEREPSEYLQTNYDVNHWPKITIVTPNYNYGHFLEETIRSVLLQGYPNLEYIIIDGGSTDNSIDIIKKYEKWLTYWVSEEDNGQPNAINKGLERATGEWFNWINSDDLLLPNALKTLIKISEVVSDANWISGARIIIDKESSFVDICAPWRTDPSVIGLGDMDLAQDATFVRTDFIRKNGIKLNENYVNVWDRIFYFQLSEYTKPLLTTSIFSAWRWHRNIKTLNRKIGHEEYSNGISPYIRKLPSFRRFIHRILRTRFGWIIRPFILLAVIYGLIPYSRNWTAVFFDRENCTFDKAPARFIMIL
jgi:glycosyltransferase involved in cell wall biosynthesis